MQSTAGIESIELDVYHFPVYSDVAYLSVAHHASLLMIHMSSTRDSAWNENKLRREHIRATFAIGAIALNYYLIQAFGTSLVIPNIPPGWEKILYWVQPTQIDVTRVIMTFFGGYVLAMAIATSEDLVESYSWRVVCRLAQGIGKVFYVVGVSLLLVAGVYFFAPLLPYVVAVLLVYMLVRFVHAKLK